MELRQLSCFVLMPEQLHFRQAAALTKAGAAFYERAVRILGEVDLSAEIVGLAGKGGAFDP